MNTQNNPTNLANLANLANPINPLEHIIKYLQHKDKLILASSILDIFKEDSKNLEQFDILGKLYHDIKSYSNALECVYKCKEISKPEYHYNINCNLIKILNEINEPLEALELIHENLETNADDISMKMEENFSYFLLNNKQKSEEILRGLLLRNDLSAEIKAKINFNLGTYDLEAGKFQQGLRGFILAGKSVGIWPDDNLPQHLKITDNNPLKLGDTLLIKADGGIGDEIINIRFMRILKERGINATWLTTRKDLKELFNYNGYPTIHYDDFEGYYKYNKVTTSMQLPIWLNLDESELWQGRYLEPLPESIEKFKHLQGGIGLRWSGNPFYEQALNRTIDIDGIIEIITKEYPNKRLYSLQFPSDSIVLNRYPEITDLALYISSFSDTLAIMDKLDLVVTSCTSVVHGAGSLGKDTIVFVPISAYYTWDSPHTSRAENESIWYNTNLKVLKQQTWKSWEEPLVDFTEYINNTTNKTPKEKHD